MRIILLFLLPILFLGCISNSSTVNTPPVADAGDFQYLDTGSVVQLDGRASSDINGDALSYRWSFDAKPVGSNAAIEPSNSATPRFTADLEGDYKIRLVVNDGQIDSEPSFVTVSTVTFVDPSTGPQADNQIFTPSSATLTAQPMLVILLEFANQKFVSSNAMWQAKMFGNTSGQLNHYYHEISADQFEFSPANDQGAVVGGIVKVDFSDDPQFSQHPDPNIDNSYEYHPYLKAAIENVYANGFDFKLYDSDNNSKITPDELIITFIMAGGEDAYTGEIATNGIWAHQYCTSASYTPEVNGVDVMQCDLTGIAEGNYAIFGEQHYDLDRFGNIDASHDATVGIIAHELGHSAFDLPDLYYGSSTRIGYYGLMSNGSWGQASLSGEAGDTPTHMCAWSKIDVGWYSNQTSSNDPYSDLFVHATGGSDYNIIKTPFNNSNDEYFLVENRGEIGYDSGLNYINEAYAGGIAIWHIDEAVIRAKRDGNIINSDKDHKGVDLEEAAGPSVDIGAGDPVLNLYYSGNVDEFTPNTLPNTNLYTNERSFIFFTGISSISNTMTVRINNPITNPQ